MNDFTEPATFVAARRIATALAIAHVGGVQAMANAETVSACAELEVDHDLLYCTLRTLAATIEAMSRGLASELVSDLPDVGPDDTRDELMVTAIRNCVSSMTIGVG